MTHNDLKAKLMEELEAFPYKQFHNYDCALGNFHTPGPCNCDMGGLKPFLSRTYDEIARAAGEAGRVNTLQLSRYVKNHALPDNNRTTLTNSYRAGHAEAIAQSSRQLAEHFGETKSVDNCA